MPRSRRDDDDDDDYDRPRRRQRRRDDDDDDHDPERGGGGGVPVGVIVGGALVLGVLVVGGILMVIGVANRRPAPDAGPAVAEKGDPVPGTDPRPAPVGVPKPGKEVVVLPPPPPPKPRVGVALPVDGPGAAYYAFAGGEDGVVAYIGMDSRNGEILTVARTKTGEMIGRTQIKVGDDGAAFAVAPGGKYAGVLGIAPFEGDPVVIHDVPGGTSYRFTPYSKKGNITNPGLIGFGFPAADRLLTVNETSGFDIWEVPAMKRVAGQPGRPPSSTPFVANNGFSKCPVNYALSADGKTFAVFDGAGFAFFDAATAAPKAKTEPLLAPKQLSMNSWGCAFNAAGSKFAFMATLYAPKQATGLIVWEPATGKRLSFTPVDHGKHGAGFAWYGPDHLALWQGGRGRAEIMEVKTGQIVAEATVSLTGQQQSIAASTPGDKLWYTYNANGYDARAAGARLVSAPAPAVLPGKTLSLTPDGPQWR